MEVIPFMPLPIPLLKSLASPLEGAGFRIGRAFPFLREDLFTAGIKMTVEEYGSVMALSFAFYSVFFSAIIGLVLTKFVFSSTKIFGTTIMHSWLLGVVIGIAAGALVSAQFLAYPKIRTKKRVRNIEQNLVFALRTILVQLKSGVSLFDSLYSVSSAKRYGELSAELKQAVDSISTGVSESVALQELAVRNPSPYLRKVLWQIVNGMRAGADVIDVLDESVATIMREQRIEIEKYGNSLKVLSLVYLMIGVIIPALGLTFLIVIGSFPKIKITETLFWFMLGGVILMEFMFIGLMKSKRPTLMSE